MVSAISRGIGAGISLFLMAIGANVVWKKVSAWKQAYDAKNVQ